MQKPLHVLRTLCAASLLAAPLSLPRAAQAPSDFAVVIGHALLCLNQMDPGYYYAYLTKAFGKSYKHADGAFWFRAGTTIWGAPVSEMMVSDGESGQAFIGAVIDMPPEQLETAIATNAGIRYTKLDASKYPVRESPPGSTIVYFKQKSKIYCAKSQQLLPPKRQ